MFSAGAFALVSLHGHAAGFDCAKAASVTEKAICADATLSKLDGALSVAWKNAVDVATDPVAVKSSQVQWLKRRDACGADTACLTARYNERLAVLTIAEAAAETDQAGHRLEGLLAQTAGTSSDAEEKRCTAEKRLCLRVLRDAADSPPTIEIEHVGTNVSTFRFALPGDSDGGQDTSITLWPHVLRLADDHDTILVGVEVQTQASYSGGGGSASALRLFEIDRDKSTFREHEVLSVPVAGSLMIRACFSERDQRRRLDACHDEYEFAATLGLDHAVKSGFPRLVYQTRATSFPGKVSRSKDSLAGPPLRKRDLVTAVDARCSFTRTFHFDAKPGVYTPDTPLPDCSDYTVP